MSAVHVFFIEYYSTFSTDCTGNEYLHEHSICVIKGSRLRKLAPSLAIVLDQYLLYWRIYLCICYSTPSS